MGVSLYNFKDAEHAHPRGLGLGVAPGPIPDGCLLDKKKPGSDLLSHGLNPAVPSAQKGLAAMFGMGTESPPSNYKQFIPLIKVLPWVPRPLAVFGNGRVFVQF